MSMPTDTSRGRWARTGSARLDVLFIAVSCGILAVIGFKIWSNDPPEGEIIEKDGVIECRLGEVPPGERISRFVPLRNNTPHPLTIEEVLSSCSCMKVSVEDRVIPPDGKTQLQATIETPQNRGKFNAEIAVTFAGSEDPRLVRLVGVVGAWLDTDPLTLDFGQVCRDETVSKRLELFVSEPWPEEKRSLRCTLPHAQVAVVETSDNGRRLVCDVRFAPPSTAPLREDAGAVEIGWEGRPERKFKVPCRARVVSDWAHEPGVVFLGKLKASQQTPFEMVIRKRSARPGEEWREGCAAEVTGQSGSTVSARTDGDRLIVAGRVGPAPAGMRGVVAEAVVVKSASGSALVEIPILWEWE